MAHADEFVLYDDVQYTRHDWRNRNRIRTRQGVRWLTIPASVPQWPHQTVRQTRVSSPAWRRKHWTTLRQSYARAGGFREYGGWFADLYDACRCASLSEINRHFLEAICGILGIRTVMSSSADYRLVEGRTERLVAICRQARATEYWSGPSARAYLDEALFQAAGIDVRYADYSNYPDYPHVHGPSAIPLSIVDLILNVGADAVRYMKSVAPVSVT